MFETEKVSITIIVPVFNEERYIQGFLHSLLTQSVFGNGSYISDVIMVDGGAAIKQLS